MALRRIPIQNLADPRHEVVVLEGRANERLPSNRVYVDLDTGKVINGSKGARLSQLRGREIELPRTTWFSLNVNRLRKETLEMQRIFNGRFQLYEDTEKSGRSWARFIWIGFDPRGRHEIVARYSKLHPFRQMEIKVIPDIETKHKIGGGICYLEDHEWNPDWTAATAIATAIRFLSDYYNGRI